MPAKRNPDLYNSYYDPSAPVPCDSCPLRKTCSTEALECKDFISYASKGHMKKTKRRAFPIAERRYQPKE